MIDVTDAERYEVNEIVKKGKHAFITRDRKVLKKVCSRYGRDVEKTCIKVFYGNPLKKGQTLKDALWGDNRPTFEHLRKNVKLLEGSQIQNILWKHNISPRVYAVFEAKLGKRRVGCQLTEFVEGNATREMQDCHAMYANLNEMGKVYGFKAWKDILNHEDIINGKFVDPQPFAFEIEPYQKYTQSIYRNKGRYGKIYYQDEPAIGLTNSPRKSEDRIKYMALDSVSFGNKVVWDVGCAGGYFCRYASENGAKRVVGLDMKEPLEAAFHVGNYLNYFNIDYVECNLKGGIPIDIPKADIAFFLSMNLHVGNLEQLKDVPLVIFEDNSRDKRNETSPGKPWTDWFNKITFVGRGKDHGNKSCYFLENK
jgi:hypothetical protein